MQPDARVVVLTADFEQNADLDRRLKLIGFLFSAGPHERDEGPGSSPELRTDDPLSPRETGKTPWPPP